MEIEIKSLADLQTAYEAMKKELTEKGAENVKNFDEKMAAIEAAIKEVKEAKPEVTAEEVKKLKEDLDTTVKALDIVQIRMKNAGGNNPTKQESKPFNEILAETIERHADEIRNYRKGRIVEMDMFPDQPKQKDKEGRMYVKDAGQMSITANFPSAAEFITDRRTQMIEKPYDRVWLADLLPQGTTDSPSILYPKENGGEGGAALWTDPTADKPLMDYDFTTQQAYVKWIAGIVIVPREMLDDISWLTSYIRAKMLVSLKIAENGFVLNGNSVAPAVDGLLDVATAYNNSGSYTKEVEMLIDAAYGQIVTNTFNYYRGNVAVVHPLDNVAMLLNTASGSGEYNNPNGTGGGVNGQFNIPGLQIVQTTQVGSQGNFIVFDRTATSFIRRMQPELRLFEDATLAKKNLVMFRVEERATLAIFNNDAVVTNISSS